MCKPVGCPKCLHTTFHKGSCENPQCDYDPLHNNIVANMNPDALDNFIPMGPHLRIVAVHKPFLRVAINGSRERIDQLTKELMIEVQIWSRPAGSDIFDYDLYGFDLVKDQAKRLLKI